MAKSNNGSSMPNQGDNRTSRKQGNNGANMSVGAKSKPAKQNAKVWKSKGIKNPKVQDWLA